MVEFRKAPEGDELIEIAEKLLKENPDHELIQEARIAYVYRDKATKYRGKVKLGEAHKTSKREGTLHGYDFEIVIAEDMWYTLTDIQKKILVDHELYHCSMDNKGNWSVAPHDFEEFLPIIKKYGDDAIEVRELLKAVEEGIDL